MPCEYSLHFLMSIDDLIVRSFVCVRMWSVAVEDARAAAPTSDDTGVRPHTAPVATDHCEHGLRPTTAPAERLKGEKGSAPTLCINTDGIVLSATASAKSALEAEAARVIGARAKAMLVRQLHKHGATMALGDAGTHNLHPHLRLHQVRTSASRSRNRSATD